MGGPWRERGFDAADAAAGPAVAGQRAEDAWRAARRGPAGKVVLAYIAAVAMSFGLMVSLLQHGW